MMGAAKEGGHLQKLLSVHTRPEQRQTILASATIPNTGDSYKTVFKTNGLRQFDFLTSIIVAIASVQLFHVSEISTCHSMPGTTFQHKF